MNFADVTNLTKQSIKELQPFMVNYGNFYVSKVEIGATPYYAPLLMDTGSDKTWVQGEGCIGCFHLCIGNFKSKVSLTYTIVFLEYVMRTFAFVVLTMVMVVTLWVVFHLKHSHSLDVRGRCKLRKCYLWGWLAKWKYEIYDR